MSTDIFFFVAYFFIILLLFIIKWTKDFAYKNLNEFIGVTSAYLYLLADIKNDSENKIIFDLNWKDLNNFLVYSGVILAFLYLYLNYKNKKNFVNDSLLLSENNELKESLKNSKREFYKLCSDIIRSTFTDFYFSSNGNGRISIYKYDNNSFTLLGRYCPNPLFNGPGRAHYAENEGLIAKGWQKDEFIEFNIPKYSKKGREWKRYMKSICNISDSSLETIKMKSCSFYIQRINNEDSRNPLGIIVVEMLNPEKIDDQYIKHQLELNKETISSLIKSMKTITK
ncbi:hypothetical protein [Faecalibacter rhinopitheci]|uniref:Uncharacterized protein n=1 Tax=Faecalibacter rhinopitheci TaxID=2779678 RepID=A0A8J7FT46_9FLAO|nr:hypothetical protein [Faecalibacter rhinopitheci]MBF0598453.1 hypothetical protein [Faecalibacter rhinopitheci]